VLLVAPAPALSAVQCDDRVGRAVLRGLGARQVLEGALVAPGALARAVDYLHASSMLGLAAVDARHRRAALVSAAVSVALARHRRG
jgi:hypothetical protein